jgi:hypothetical protein
MKKDAVLEPAAVAQRSQGLQVLRQRSGPRDWEQAALDQVARHVAELDRYRPELRELGWESEAFERLRSVLKR